MTKERTGKEQETMENKDVNYIRNTPSLKKDLLALLAKASMLAMFFVLMFTFVFGIVRCADPSMSSSIKDGDLVIYHRYNSSGYLPREVVVIKTETGETQVRRVIAVEGDAVDITENGLLINGSFQQEQDIFEKTERYQTGVLFPLIVPEGEIFVLSDNRPFADDSRLYGCVKTAETKGKVISIFRRRSI
jgi:signal peptidase I